MTPVDDLVDTLWRAGVDMDEVGRRSTADRLVIEREDLDAELIIQYGPWEPLPGMCWPFRWRMWAGSGQGTGLRTTELANSWEGSVEGMVGKVLEFLGEEG